MVCDSPPPPPVLWLQGPILVNTHPLLTVQEPELEPGREHGSAGQAKDSGCQQPQQRRAWRWITRQLRMLMRCAYQPAGAAWGKHRGPCWKM